MENKEMTLKSRISKLVNFKLKAKAAFVDKNDR